MEVAFSKSFKKSFKKNLITSESINDFWVRLEWFINNPFDSRLRTHKLSGKLNGLWSFSLSFELRIVFYFTDDNPKRAILVDIGTHSQVY
jgi:addiction module RelE/StbE family toxin